MKAPFTPTAVAVALIFAVGSAHAATIPISQLNSQTPTYTHNSTGAIANGNFTDPDGVDADSIVADTADITVAWKMTLKSVAPATGNTRVIVDLGGGSNGLAVVWNSGGVFVQAKQGTTELGGNGSGDTAALLYSPTVADINVERTWVMSLDVDAVSSTLNLFVDNVLIGSVSDGPITDWAGGSDGGFFFNGGASTLRENFSNAASAGPPLSSEATANTAYGLRLYEDTFVVIPSPAALPAGLALMGLVAGRRRRST